MYPQPSGKAADCNSAMRWFKSDRILHIDQKEKTMGWFFNRKSKVKEVPKPAPCRHKWKDFPWYYEATYQTQCKMLHAKIVEPYVCIHCKERKDVILRDYSTTCSYEQAEGIIDGWKETYKDRMIDRVFVEDMIADMQLVDREYLAIAESLAHPPLSGLETEMQQLIKTVKAGQLPPLNPNYVPPASVKKATT